MKPTRKFFPGYSAQVCLIFSTRGLLMPNSDGPNAFANGLSATFRVETLNITQTGLLTSSFIQGSQRWQSIKLIKGSGLKISRAGFLSSVTQIPVSSALNRIQLSTEKPRFLQQRAILRPAIPRIQISGLWGHAPNNWSALILVLKRPHGR